MWYIAECMKCTPRLPVPFDVEAERDEWAKIHVTATGHEVTTWTDTASRRKQQQDR